MILQAGERTGAVLRRIALVATAVVTLSACNSNCEWGCPYPASTPEETAAAWKLLLAAPSLEVSAAETRVVAEELIRTATELVPGMTFGIGISEPQRGSGCGMPFEQTEGTRLGVHASSDADGVRMRGEVWPVFAERAEAAAARSGRITAALSPSSSPMPKERAWFPGEDKNATLRIRYNAGSVELHIWTPCRLSNRRDWRSGGIYGPDVPGWDPAPDWAVHAPFPIREYPRAPAQNWRNDPPNRPARVIFDPCTWIPDDLVVAAGLALPTRKRGGDTISNQPGQSTVFSCTFSGSVDVPGRRSVTGADIRVESSNIAFDAVVDKYAGKFENLVINDRVAIRPFDDDPDTCMIIMRTTVGSASVAVRHELDAVTEKLAPCDTALRTARIFESAIGVDN